MARKAKAKKKKGFLHRQAQLRGLVGGSKPWTYLWVFLTARRLLKRAFRDEPEIAYSEELLPGQTLVISNVEREPKVIGG
jgi:hypothetical protein